jgi:dipeptidyl aminopeptidase/acylaminoacyl peptidase
MKNTTKILLATILAILASLGSLYLSGQARTGSLKPVLQSASVGGNSSSSNSGTLNSGPQNSVVERAYAAPFPMRVAWSDGGRLYLMDGTTANSSPKLVKTGWVSWITGWSHDGRWLLLSCSSKPGGSEINYMWVVKADGTDAYQVDHTVNYIYAAWSPMDDMIAYSTSDPQGGGDLKIAKIMDGRAQISTLLHGGGFFELAWAPDGQSLAVSFPRLYGPPYSPLHVDRVTLKGVRNRLFSLGEAKRQEFYKYLWSATGMQFSPDGRYLAYHLDSNAASFSFDSQKLQVIDLQQPGNPVDLGLGLNRDGWFAWSPDSSQLAYILGEDRFFNTNKRLYTLNVKDGKVTDLSQQGMVDIYPVWTNRPPYSLLFCRGPENPKWFGNNPFAVPGMRIWMETNGLAAQLTAGSADSEDQEILGVSPDGKYVAYLRLTSPGIASLYTKSLDGGREIELLHGPLAIGQYFCPGWAQISK